MNPAALHPKINFAAAALAHGTIYGSHPEPTNGSNARAAPQQLHSQDHGPLVRLGAEETPLEGRGCGSTRLSFLSDHAETTFLREVGSHVEGTISRVD